MHDSFTPLGGMAPLVLMQLGEVVFGGVGTGLYGMLAFAILVVFIAGLMIGRTPEYLGKKIASHEMKMVSIALLITPLVVLVGVAVAVLSDSGRLERGQPWRAWFYGNPLRPDVGGQQQRQRFCGSVGQYAVLQHPAGHCHVVGALWCDRPVLALAGSLAAKNRIPTGSGTLPTRGPLFVGLLIGVVLLVGLLNHIPELALGPIVEHPDALEG